MKPKRYVYKVATEGERITTPGDSIFCTYNLTAETVAKAAEEALKIDQHKDKACLFSVLSVERIGEEISRDD